MSVLRRRLASTSQHVQVAWAAEEPWFLSPASDAAFSGRLLHFSIPVRHLNDLGSQETLVAPTLGNFHEDSSVDELAKVCCRSSWCNVQA